jgi:uncharacterized protein YneF (UPF0154 family)
VQEVLENYPRLTAEAVQAVFAYAGECLSEEALFDMPRAAEGETSEHEISRQ